jgi:predicted  nucleic acid-binding Zn-ribbon protein
LQELDKVIRGIAQEMEKLPEVLETETARLQELKAEHAALAQELEDLKTQRRAVEGDIAELEESIKKSRQRLMEIKSNIEYRAMLKEIAYKEDQRDKTETRLLEGLELIEAKTQALAALDLEIREQQAILAREDEKVKTQLKELKKELAGLEKQRGGLRKGMPAQLIKRYEFIRERRNGTAIAPVREGVCLGCNMNILPQQFIDLQKGDEILQCPHCQRILYWVDEMAEEAVN